MPAGISRSTRVAKALSTVSGIDIANMPSYAFISAEVILWFMPTIPSVRKTWTCARLSAVGGAAVGEVVAAERPRRGAKFRGRRGFFPGVGKVAEICLVAAARNSPSVRVRDAEARARGRRMVTGDEANIPEADMIGPWHPLAGV